MVKVEWTERAIKDLEELDKAVARRILRKVDWFSRNFERLALEPLSGEFKGMFKLRIGDWRVVYAVGRKSITVQFIGNRKDIYKIK